MTDVIDEDTILIEEKKEVVEEKKEAVEEKKEEKVVEEKKETVEEKIPDGYNKYTNDIGLFEGEFKNGKLINGVIKEFSGCVFTGKFKNGLLHGKGKSSTPFGITCEGVFEDGWLIDGKRTYENGDYCEGKFDKSGYLTHGVADFKDEKDSGDFRNGVLHGKGTVAYTNADFPITLCEGEFKNGQLNGRGTIVYRNGDSVEGEFLNGERHGEITITHANGNVWKGQYNYGKKTGTSTVITTHKYKEYWSNGALLYDGDFYQYIADRANILLPTLAGMLLLRKFMNPRVDIFASNINRAIMALIIFLIMIKTMHGK